MMNKNKKTKKQKNKNKNKKMFLYNGSFFISCDISSVKLNLVDRLLFYASKHTLQIIMGELLVGGIFFACIAFMVLGKAAAGSNRVSPYSG